MAERLAERPRPTAQGGFFDDADSPVGLGVFLNAGDPPWSTLGEIVAMLDEAGVDCLELAVPFPDSPTDGEVIRRSAARALATGADLHRTLAFVADLAPTLRRMRVALLADWSHTVRPYGLEAFVADVRASGADAALLHGVPPRVRPDYLAAAAEAGLPVVTTCYHATSTAETVRQAADQATAFVYLVARYGRSGQASGRVRGAAGEPALAETVSALCRAGSRPVAVGFGLSTAADLQRVAASGADAALVGSAAVARVEHSLHTGADVVADLRRFVTGLRSPATEPPRPLPKGSP